MFHKIAFLKYDYLNKKTIAYLDDGSEFFYYQKPIKIINDWCIYNGSTAEGRMTAFQKLTSTRQKPAVLINERSRIVFFPTLSKDSNECIWLNNRKILKTKEIDPHHTEVIFQTGFKTVFDLNRRIIENQMKRCRTFLSSLDYNQQMPL